MCTIAGFCNFHTNFKEKESYYHKILRNMSNELSHWGFSQYESFLNDNLGLTSHFIYEHQYAISCNGELYNVKELIEELKQTGYLFQTGSDCEVILYCYLHFGPEFVSRLNGIFAFVIWDDKKKNLYLYRDRIGAKPLFYYQDPTRKHAPLIFASKPNALFSHPDATPILTDDSLREILAIGPARTSGNGIFKNVYEVLPGHYLCYNLNGLSDHTYWDLHAVEHTDNYATTVDKVSYLVKDAIHRQMSSDMPISSFLSGGIDSSIVTAIAANHLKEHGEVLHTFSFDFKENDKYFLSNAFQPERDLPYIKIMLNKYQTHHTFLECDETQLIDTLYTATTARNYPGMADIDASLLYFCSIVAKQHSIALTGECADEIFGGYPWFYRLELLNTDGFPWSYDMSMRTLFLKDSVTEKFDLKAYAYDRYQTSLSHAPILHGESGEATRRRQIFYLCIKWFMQTLLDRMDRMGSYSGLIGRIPFADYRIIEYVFNVPWEMKYKNGLEKSLLRDAVGDLLPLELLYRKKSPYPKTYHPGYERLLIEHFHQILQDKNAPILPLLDTDKVLRFLSSPKEYGKPWYGQLMAGPQLIAYFIQINHWMKQYDFSL